MNSGLGLIIIFSGFLSDIKYIDLIKVSLINLSLSIELFIIYED